MFKQSRILILSLLGGFALCGASTATAEVETCEVAALFGQIDRNLCSSNRIKMSAEDSRQPVICAAAMNKRGNQNDVLKVCAGTRNARLSLTCYDNRPHLLAPGGECGTRFNDPKYEPAVYEEDTCSLPNVKQLGSHLPKNINLNDLKRIIK